MELKQLNDYVPIITLIGLLVNIWLSRQAMKTAQTNEKYKVSAGFREKALDHLKDGRKRIAQTVDLTTVMDAVDSCDVPVMIKFFRDKYLLTYDVYSELRYLFLEEPQAELDLLRENADKCDAKCFETLYDAKSSGKNQVPEFKVLILSFIKAINEFNKRLFEEIDRMMAKEASALRKIE